MTPALVAAARNTRSAAEGEITMTDEELQKVIQDVTNDIDNLPKDEASRKRMLSLKKDILCKIKEARETNDKDIELVNTALYGLVTSMGESHPYLMYLVQSNIGRMNMF